MVNLVDMSVDEAASKALEFLLTDGKYGYAVEDLEAEFLDSYTPSLAESASAWSYVKWESPESVSRDGLTAKREAAYGGEGKGDEYWVVISLSDGNTTRYFRKDGWYASYTGGELDGDTREVRPTERVVTYYE